MKKLTTLIFATAFAAAITGNSAIAQSGDPSDGTHTLARASITAGGSIASNGQYHINGTAGQMGFTGDMSGGGYGFIAEFWWNSEPAQREELIFRDSFESI